MEGQQGRSTFTFTTTPTLRFLTVEGKFPCSGGLLSSLLLHSSVFQDILSFPLKLRSPQGLNLNLSQKEERISTCSALATGPHCTQACIRGTLVHPSSRPCVVGSTLILYTRGLRLGEMKWLMLECSHGKTTPLSFRNIWESPPNGSSKTEFVLLLLYQVRSSIALLPII